MTARSLHCWPLLSTSSLQKDLLVRGQWNPSLVSGFLWIATSLRCHCHCSPWLWCNSVSPAGPQLEQLCTVTAICVELWPAATPAFPIPALNISPAGLPSSVLKYPKMPSQVPSLPCPFSKSIWVSGVIVAVKRGGHRDVGVCSDWGAQVASGVP